MATWITLLSLIGIIVRWVRPFASEILSLEKTPVFKKPNRPVNYSVRSASLHKAANAELTRTIFSIVPIVSVAFGLSPGNVADHRFVSQSKHKHGVLANRILRPARAMDHYRNLGRHPLPFVY